MKKRKKNNIKYSAILILLSLFLFVLISLRIVYLATSKEVDGKNLQELASRRTTKKDIIYATRGSIYASNGDLLAHNVSSYKLIAYLDPKRTTNKKKPEHVIDKEKTAEALAPILDMTKEEVLKYLSKEHVYQTEFGTKGKNLNEITKNKIEDLNLPGLDFIESYRRYYPKGDFASYTIGYAKEKSEEDTSVKGEMGIESYYDKTLRGENGYIRYQKDLKGYRIADTKTYEKEAVSGKDIYLTIDPNIQFYVENAIQAQDEGYDWDWYHMTIMDAKTGAILATSTHPSFDPNKRDLTSYLDNLVSNPFEPGSTMKTFTYMAAMESGVYNGNETYLSGVYHTSDGTEIGDWKRSGWGVISFDRGYPLSSNVGVINLIKRHMNATTLRTYFKKLGFGRKTGITLPNESTGVLNFKYETEILNAGFGQGITTTPIQNVKALTPLTNDGMLLRPYIVQKIVDPETKEVILENKREEIERVASTKTVEKMTSLMDKTVNEAGNTGGAYHLESNELIGKTGTAQIAKERGGGYLDGAYNVITSFSGFYPKSNPKVIIYASVKKPSGGSQKPLSNGVLDVVNNIIKYYGGAEDTTAIETYYYKLPNLVNKTTDYAKTTLDTNKIKYELLGNGDKIIKQFPNSNITITNYDKVFLITNDKELKVPNVVGLSSKNAKAILEYLGFKVKLDGVGYVEKQSIEPNTNIDKKEITLTLKTKYSE